VAYADLRFNVSLERKSLGDQTSGDVADVGKAARELAKQQAKTKSADKRIAELKEKLNEEKKLRKEAERVASREKKSAVAAKAKAAKAKADASAGGSDETALVVLQSSAAVPFDGRSSANLGELRRMMAGDPSHLDELYQQAQHGRGTTPVSPSTLDHNYSYGPRWTATHRDSKKIYLYTTP